jgi:type IV pilus assembly protein PilN
MIRINLLPVRHSRRQEQVRNEMVLAGVGLGAITVGMGLMYMLVANQVSEARASNDALRQQINKTNEIVAEVDEQERLAQDLRTKLGVIMGLKANRVGPVHMLDELSQASPEKLQLRSVEEDDRKVGVTGVAVTNEVISQFLSNLEESEYFSEVYLNAIDQTEVGGVKLKEFSITAKLVVPGFDQDESKDDAKKKGKRSKKK